MEKQKKKQNGITLIALVISIIVMLILAGVSLNLTIGDNGIVSQAQAAKIAQEDAVWDENAQSILAEAMMNRELIEALTEEEIASANGDENIIKSMKLAKMKDYLYSKFSANSENPDDLIVSLVGDGYMIVDGERVYKINSEFSEGLNVASAKMLVETNSDWMFTPQAGGTCIITASLRTLSGEIAIPAILVDRDSKVAYQVTGLGNDLFNYATGITRVDFSQVGTNLKTIGARTFAFCSNLQITIPDDLPSSVTSIGDKAFYNCKLLEGNINTIQTHGYTLGKGVFMKCPNLSGDIQLVFNENFFLDEGGNPVATEVEEGQFNGYSGLTGTLTIPNYITKIGSYAFYGCSGISGLAFEEGSTCSSIGSYAFYECSGISNSLVLPNSVTSLASYAFAYSGITGLTLPNAITSIGSYAFYFCNKMTGTVTFPTTLSTLGDYAFSYATISKIHYNYDSSTNKGMVSSGYYSFYYCTSLTTIESSDTYSFPRSLTSISGGSFCHCHNLGTISFPDSVTTINSGGFQDDYKVNVSRWSTGLVTLGGSCFYNCSALKTLPDKTNLKYINGSTFRNCTQLGNNNGSKTNIITWISGSKITSISDQAFMADTYLDGSWNGTISGVTISGSPFVGTSVTLSLTLATNATSIAANQFAGATSITYNGTTYSGTGTLTLPSTVTSIGSSAFAGCKAFSKIVIPSSVTSIGSSAFANCSVSTVEFATGSPITSIPNSCFQRTNISSIVWPSGLKTIGSSAFNNTYNFKTITFPSTLETIGDSAFSWAGATTVNFNSGLKTIGNSAFCGDGLTTVVIPDTVTSLGTHVFHRCQSITSITFGSGITSIPNSICNFPMSGDGYNNSGKLATVTFRGNVTSIGSYAFCKQPKLTTINFNATGGGWSSLTSIGTKAFYNCTSLTGDINLRTNCTLYEDSFENCPANVSKSVIP